MWGCGGKWMEDAVREFHVAMRQPAPYVEGRGPVLDLKGVRRELRAKLILEEALEVIDALGYDVAVSRSADMAAPRKLTMGVLQLVRMRAPDWPEVVDGLCDLLYVTFGFGVEMGISLGPFFGEVHRSNMKKAGGPVRADGKVLKPEGWEPPRIAMLWARVCERAKVCWECGAPLPYGGHVATKLCDACLEPEDP